jgi:hypothetical protein
MDKECGSSHSIFSNAKKIISIQHQIQHQIHHQSHPNQNLMTQTTKKKTGDLSVI